MGSAQILSEPQCPCLHEKDNESPYLIGLLWEVSGMMLAKHLALSPAQYLLILVTAISISTTVTH